MRRWEAQYGGAGPTHAAPAAPSPQADPAREAAALLEAWERSGYNLAAHAEQHGAQQLEAQHEPLAASPATPPGRRRVEGGPTPQKVARLSSEAEFFPLTDELDAVMKGTQAEVEEDLPAASQTQEEADNIFAPRIVGRAATPKVAPLATPTGPAGSPGTTGTSAFSARQGRRSIGVSDPAGVHHAGPRCLRSENTSLKEELGGRLSRIEDRLAATIALAEHAAVQSGAAKLAAANASSAAKEALRLSKERAAATEDLQRRMAALELKGPTASGAGAGGEPRHMRRVLVLTGFPKASKRSDLLDVAGELLTRLRATQRLLADALAEQPRGGSPQGDEGPPPETATSF